MTVLFKQFSLDNDGDNDKPFKCKLCDGLKNIKWRCMECKMKICDKCKIIHGSTRASTSHTIISFNDIDCCFLDIQIKQRIKKMACPKHTYLTYSLFCKTCDYLVCESCVSQNHVLHDIYGIDQFIGERLRAEGKEVSENLPKRFLARSPSQDDDYCIVTMASFRTEHRLVTNIPVIYFLKTVSAETAWIGCKENQVMQKVTLPIKSKRVCMKFLFKALKRDIECVQIDQIEGFEAIDIAVIDGDILFLSFSDHNLKRAFTDAYGQKQICNIHNFDPLDPTCIHFERKNKLIWIGLKERGKDCIYPMSTRKIIAISETSHVEKTFEYSTNGKRLFTFPFRISDIDGHVCVLDRTNRTTGRVLSLNSLGHRMWEYDNPQETNACVKPFFPTAMATTESNKIVVLDAANRTLHVLNKAGNMIVIKSMSELKIDQPFSLDIDKTGQLWIGSACDKSSEEMKAKIYVLNMSIL